MKEIVIKILSHDEAERKLQAHHSDEPKSYDEHVESRHTEVFIASKSNKSAARAKLVSLVNNAMDALISKQAEVEVAEAATPAKSIADSNITLTGVGADVTPLVA